MVAISLYRGNLHRVPDVPRRWLMPTPKISLKDFRILLDRRSRALSRLHSSTTSSNPNPNPNPDEKEEEEEEEEEEKKEEERENNDFPNNDSVPPPQSDPPKITTTHPEGEEADLKEGGICEEEANESDASKDAEPEVPQSDANPVDSNADLQDDKAPETLENTKAETSTKVDALTDKEMRKKEVEEKLLVLNEKKHNLVQVLKQILNAEEELKRQNSTQGTGIRPAVPLQVDVTNDSGSLTRLATPRLGSEGNLGGDMEGGEADDASNHSMHPRHLPRMSSTSPHSDSPHRRPAFSAVPHPSRPSLAVASSPSRFAPTGHQGHPANPPMVSVSGTSYIASSPSPVASGGTSSFRDARLPSPWN